MDFDTQIKMTVWRDDVGDVDVVATVAGYVLVGGSDPEVGYDREYVDGVKLTSIQLEGVAILTKDERLELIEMVDEWAREHVEL